MLKPDLPTKRPEQQLQLNIIRMLKIKGWYVNVTHGNLYQQGFPDLYAMHPVYGQRWIEIKLPNMDRSRFTNAQAKWFPLMDSCKIGIWILTGSTEDEYQKLFKEPNWKGYYLQWIQRGI